VSIGLVDTNVLLRHILGDHPDHSPRAKAFVTRLERGELVATLADTVVFETVFVLESFNKLPRAVIRDGVLPIVLLPGIVLAGKQIYRRVFDWYVDHRRLTFADCYHAALVERQGLPAIISFDQDYDRLPEVRRIEPDEPAATNGQRA
jgi:predicted nucleic acid-binding protein